MDVKLWQHQLDAVEKAKGRVGHALLFDPGVGKTGTAIQIIRNVMNETKTYKKVLILTPPMVVPQFKEEFKRFSKIDPTQIVLLQDTQKDRLKKFLSARNTPKIYITNYESLLMKDLYQELKKWGPEIIVFDESHRLKNHAAARSKLAYDLANTWLKGQLVHKPLTLILTGTPVLNSPMDLFQQFKIMLSGFPLPDGRLIYNFYEFRARYFRDRNAGMPKGKYFPNFEVATLKKDMFDAMTELNEIVSKYSSVAKIKDCLDLPEDITTVVKVGMSKEQARTYRELKEDLVTYIDSGACVGNLAIVKALRLMQIVSGFISVKEDIEQKLVQFKENPKIEALRELLEEITPTAKVLVWAVWKENYEQIRELLKELDIGYVEAHGEISEAKRSDAVRLFREDGRTRVFLGHPGSGGIGLNLVSASYSIFFSRTFSLEHYLQARARNVRGGQDKTVIHYDLVTMNTIDEIVLEKLSQKQQIGEKLLGELSKSLAQQQLL